MQPFFVTVAFCKICLLDPAGSPGRSCTVLCIDPMLQRIAHGTGAWHGVVTIVSVMAPACNEAAVSNASPCRFWACGSDSLAHVFVNVLRIIVLPNSIGGRAASMRVQSVCAPLSPSTKISILPGSLSTTLIYTDFAARVCVGAEACGM